MSRKVGRDNPSKKKMQMLRRAERWLKRRGYRDIKIVWSWGSRGHDIEAKKMCALTLSRGRYRLCNYRIFVLRVAYGGGYWRAQTAGKGIWAPKGEAGRRTRVLFMISDGRAVLMNYSTFKKNFKKSPSGSIHLNHLLRDK